MEPCEINIGDKLQVKRGFSYIGSAAIPVTITEKYKGNSDCGFIFNTYPKVGSGFGIDSYWLERILA